MTPSLREYTVDNPLLIEAKRFARRFMGMSKSKGGHLAYLVLTCVIYALLLVMALSYRDAFSAAGMICFQTILICVIVPTITQSAVAGERERRTWDLLLAAPVSRSQIVIGKYLSTLLVLAVLEAVFLPLVALSYAPSSETISGAALAEFISLAFGCAIGAVGTFISSTTSRAFASQTLTYVATFVWLVIYPALVSAFGLGESESKMYDFMHPILVGFETSSGLRPSYFNQNVAAYASLYSWPMQALFYTLVTALFLYLAVRSVQIRLGETGGS